MQHTLRTIFDIDGLKFDISTDGRSVLLRGSNRDGVVTLSLRLHQHPRLRLNKYSPITFAGEVVSRRTDSGFENIRRLSLRGLLRDHIHAREFSKCVHGTFRRLEMTGCSSKFVIALDNGVHPDLEEIYPENGDICGVIAWLLYCRAVGWPRSGLSTS